MARRRVYFCLLSVVCVFLVCGEAYSNDIVENRPPELTSVSCNVDSNLGNVTQSIPIETPPGINGIQPNIGIAYNSSREMGILGAGWMLELGSIERSTRSGIPKYNSSDTYDLVMAGGRQILIYDTNAGFYRSEIEGAFMKIEFVSSGSYWLLRDKSGTKYYFGSTPDAKQADPVNSTKIFKWCLNRVEDVFGNYLVISYITDGGQIYPDKINWTGNTSQSISTFASVEFVTEARYTIYQSYRQGFKVVTKKRLSKIIVKAEGIVQREYTFLYAKSRVSYKDLLVSIKRRGADADISLPDITFSYYDFEKGFALSSSASIPTGAKFSQASGGLQPNQDLGVRIADINNDGYPDIIKDYASVDSSNNVTLHTKETYLNNKQNGWVLNTSWALPEPFKENTQEGITFIKEVSSSSGKLYPDYALMTADVDSDGKSDLIQSHLYYKIQGNNVETGYHRRFYSYTQNGWEMKGWLMPSGTDFMIWLTQDNGGSFSYRLESLGNYLSDVDGDGDLDLVTSRKNKQTSSFNDATENYKKVFLNLMPKNRWNNVPSESWTRPDNEYTDLANGAQLLDLNGDNLPEIFYCRAGTNKVFMNNGACWVEDTSSPWINTYGLGDLKDGSTQMADINGDGLTDMIIAKGGSQNGSRVLINTGNGWVQDDSWIMPEGNFTNLGTRLLDADSNTMMDFIIHYNGGAPKLYVNQGKPCDLLKQTDNGVGGVIDFSYISSAQFQQDFMPFSMPVIHSVTKSNKLGDSFTTLYEYTQGLWAPNQYELADDVMILTGHRGFRGFGDVKITDAEGNCTESIYLKDYYTKGRLKEMKIFDKTGKILRREAFTWAEQNIINGSKFIYPAYKNIYVYNNAGDAYTSWHMEYKYDENPQYGNITSIIEPLFGRKTEYTYYYNPDKWINGIPKQVIVKDSNDNPLRKVLYYYDNNNDNQNVLPVQGLLTQTELWGGTINANDNPKFGYEYNSLGLITKFTEPNEYLKSPDARKSTVVSYDTEYGMFPVRVTNPLGHTINASYYGISGIPLSDESGFSGLWGQIKDIEDANGQKASEVYDSFGRPVKSIGPLDSINLPTESIEYNLTPMYTKITSSERVQHGQNAVINSYQYIDGLGRHLYTKTPSAVEGKYIVNGQAKYNSQGSVIDAYQPFFSVNSLDTIDQINNSRVHISYEYDGMSRVTKTINPDGTFSNVVYDKLKIDVFDENGHKHTAEFDQEGKLKKRIEWTGADGRFSSVYPDTNGWTEYTNMLYNYDVTGDLTEAIDNNSNKTTIVYDALGRKKSTTDPDMGKWDYAYDLNGNCVSQQDAKNSQVQFTFDALNRISSKILPDGGESLYTYDSSNVDYSKGFLTALSYNGTDKTDYKYDALGRITKELQKIGSGVYSTEGNFDALDRITSLIYPNGLKVNYTYNIDGNLSRVSIDRSGAQNPPSQNLPAQPVLNEPAAGNKEASLSWQGVSGADGYRVYYGTQTDNLNIYKDAGNKTSFIVTGLTNNANYYFSIAGYNRSGEGIHSLVKSSTPQIPLPAKPANVTAVPDVGKVTLSWDSALYASEYRIQYGTESTNLSQTINGIIQTTHEITGLNYDTAYYFRVSAKNESGYGEASDIVSCVTQHPPAPPAPVLNNPSAGDSQISLSWNAVAGSIGYKLEYKLTSGGTWGLAYNGANTSYIVTGLTNGVSYDFRVFAYNQWETSQASDVKTSAPLEAQVQIALDAMNNASLNNSAQISLSQAVASQGTNRVLIVTISLEDFSTAPQANSVTCAGNAMTLIDRQSISATGVKSAVEMWYLLNPPSGINTIQAQFNITVDHIAIGSVSLTGVKQSAPQIISKSSGKTTTASVSLANVPSGAWVFDTLFYDTAATWVSIGTGQTQCYKKDMSAGTHGSSYKPNVSQGTVSMQWSLTFGFASNWALMAVSFAPAAVQTASAGKYGLADESLRRKIDGRWTSDDGRDKWNNTSQLVIASKPKALPNEAIYSTVIASEPQQSSKRSNLSFRNFFQTLKDLFTIQDLYAATDLDFTTFTESDPKNQITLSPVSAVFTGIETRATKAYVYKAYQTQGDFTYEFDAKITSISTVNSDTVLCGITNKSASAYPSWTDGIYFGVNGMFAMTGGTGVKLLIKPIGQSAVSSAVSLYLNRRYYFRFKRQGNTVTVQAYSDTARTQLVTSVSANFNANSFSNLYAFSTNGSSSSLTGRKISGDISNLRDGASQVPLPSAPVLNQVYTGQNSAYLSWASVNYAVSYTVHYGTSSRNYTFKEEGISGTTTILSTSNLINGTKYYFAVSAQNSAGSSGYSNELSGTPQYVPPEIAPQNVSGTAGIGAVTLNWGTVNNTTGYIIKYGTVSGTYTSEIDAGNTTQKAIDGLEYNKQYYFVVLAYNPGGNGPASNEVSITTLAPPVPAKPALNEPVAGDASVLLSWNSVTGAIGYKIRYRQNGESYADNWIDAGNVTQYNVSGLTNNITYYFQLAAYNAGGDSEASDEKSAVPYAILLPVKPVLNQPKPGNMKVSLTWSVVSEADGYKISYKKDGETYSAFNDIGNITSYTLQNLINGAAYYFKIIAYNEAGSGPESDAVSAIPQALPLSLDIITNIDYNAAGLEEKIFYGNGNVTEYEYDANLRLSRVHTYTLENTPLQDIRYTYDGVGNIIRIDDFVHTATQNFTYDSIGRLIAGEGPGGSKYYSYDPIDNITNNAGAGYAYGNGIDAGVHAVVSGGGSSFTYDANANLIKEEGLDTREYFYDGENRLSEIVKDNSTLARFEYDDYGQRTKKVINPDTSIFVGDYYEEKGNAATSHIYIGSERIASLTNDDIQYIYTDHLGSPNVVINDAGSIIDVVEYEPYGGFSRHDTLPNAGEGRFYTNQYRDNESGLYYYGGRYYNPRTTRFITADPFVSDPSSPQGFNRFAYVSNNPINFTDPSGYEEVELEKITVYAHRPEPEVEGYNPGLESLKGNLAQNVISNSGVGVSFGLDFVPGVSTAKGVVEFISGYDFIGQQPVNRGLAFVGVIGSFVPQGKAAVTAVSKSQRVIRILNKVGKHGNVISKATKRSGKTISVIGSLADTEKHIGRKGFNILSDVLKGGKWTKPINTGWLDEALERGDEFWAVTNPNKHKILMDDLKKSSAYLDVEIPHLTGKTGQSVFDKFK